MLTVLLVHISLLLSGPVSAALTPPSLFQRDADCGEVVTVSNFTWHNSTHNLDCAGAGPDPGNNTTCIGNSCGIYICDTGLPVQPAGYGPPDTLECSISSIGHCAQSNPGSVPLRTIGDGFVSCGGSYPSLFFEGSSNGNGSRKARVVVRKTIICNDDVDNPITIEGETKFNLKCSHDRDYNATCTAHDFNVTLLMPSS